MILKLPLFVIIMTDVPQALGLLVSLKFWTQEHGLSKMIVIQNINDVNEFNVSSWIESTFKVNSLHLLRQFIAATICSASQYYLGHQQKMSFCLFSGPIKEYGSRQIPNEQGKAFIYKAHFIHRGRFKVL